MPAFAIADIPAGSDVFVDSNILIYGLSHRSAECVRFLERCATEEITGVTSFEVVNEVTHRFMMLEAKALGCPRPDDLRRKHGLIPRLKAYWADVEQMLSQNLLFVETNEQLIRQAQPERINAEILTTDSLIVACMRDLGLRSLATNDRDFDRVAKIEIFRPSDIT
ncbi:MAG: type II toxin-antitoxin system VapC family toxin [Candidatus Binataceae bacterium]